MPASEARIRANQANAARSTGPRTAEGKARSRENAVKHGLTGDGIALPVEDAAEVATLERSLRAELKPSGDLGRTLVRRLALLAVRMDRCVAQQSASLTLHIVQAQAEFDAEWPEVEGVDDPLRDEARAIVSKVALFDPSKEACLARKYEAAAERGFFRALAELRQAEKRAQAEAGPSGMAPPSASLGSFVPRAATRPEVEARGARPAPKPAPPVAKLAVSAPTSRPKPVPDFFQAIEMPLASAFDVPFAIGRRR